MLYLDIPNVPPQLPPMVVAQISKPKQQNTGRTIGICHPIENKPESRSSAVNSLDPVTTSYGYLRDIEHKVISDADFLAAKMTLLQVPSYGKLTPFDGINGVSYLSADYNYTGPDRATVLVEIGGYKVKVMYYFELMQDVPGSSDQGTATDNKIICPNGYQWKISSTFSALTLTVQNGLTLHSRGTR